MGLANVLPPDQDERKRYLLKLLANISRMDPQWASSLRESSVTAFANLTARYTYDEIDLVVRRVLGRGQKEGNAPRDPVALPDFERVLAISPPTAFHSFHEVAAERFGRAGSSSA